MRRDVWAGPLAALATLLTCWSLAPVIDGHRWLLGSALVIALVLGTGAGLRALRLPPALVLPGQLAVGAVALTAAFAGESAVGGLLPGPAAVNRLGQLVVDGADTINRYAAPVPETRGLLLIVGGGVLFIAAMVDLLAVTLRSAAVAGLPLLALYAVPAAVLPGGLPWRYFVLAATGWLLLVAHDGSGRVLRWGRLLPRWGDRGTGTRQSIGSDTSALAATGRRVGALAVSLAVLVPALVPALPEGLLVRAGGSGSGPGVGGLTVINPVLTLRDSLSPRRDVEVLKYRTDQPDVAPLRIVTADVFDGANWKPRTTDVSRGQRASRGLPAPPGLTDAVPRSSYSMHVEVGSTLNQDFLPLPYPARRVDIDGAWLYDAGSLNVIGDGETVRGKQYDVEYLAVRPTAAQLEQAPPADADTIATYTRLPRSLPQSVRDKAREVTANAGNAYRRAMALQEWFRSGGNFVYSTEAPADSSGDAVADFLVARRGFCIQFSSAMAVMARSLGIPARIGVGFLPGTPDADRNFSVKLTDAHAWPELYFAGVGWVRFEPTPASRTGAAPVWAQPQTGSAPAATPSAGSAAAAAPTGSSSSLTGAAANQQKQDAQAAGASGDQTAAGGIGSKGVQVPWKLVGVVLVLLAALAVTPVSALLGRRRRRRAASDAAARVEASWSDLREGVLDLGVDLRSGVTPRQLDAELAGAVALAGPSREALGRISQTVERSRYAPVAPDADQLDDDVRTVLAAVAATRGRGTRVRARVLPRSGADRVRAGIGSVTGRVGVVGNAVDHGVARRLRSLRRIRVHRR
jgi:transglutaminase-like putative cysteine protease